MNDQNPSCSAPPLKLKPRDTAAHKGDFGRVACVGGSRGMAGSISLTSMAALRCGSGLVTAFVPDRCLETVAAFHPCLMTIPLDDDGAGVFGDCAASEMIHAVSGFGAIGCGPGMTTARGPVRIVERLLSLISSHRPALPSLVLDADAINILAAERWRNTVRAVAGNLVLTPHPGELHRLSGVSSKDRAAQVDAAAEIARDMNCVIVVKGGPTVVVDGQRRWTNTTGNPGMATAGSGDVLTGVITSLLGQKLPAWDAARLAVWVHGRSGDRAMQRLGMAGMTALDILDDVPKAIDEVMEKASS